MIEAANSVILNAPLLKGSADQVNATKSFAADPSRSSEVRRSAPQAPYISPYVVVNNDYNKAVLALRDADTGEFVVQIPSEARLEQQQRARAQQEAAIQQAVEASRELATSEVVGSAQKAQVADDIPDAQGSEPDVPVTTSNAVNAQAAISTFTAVSHQVSGVEARGSTVSIDA